MRADSSDNGDADIRMAYHSIAQSGTLNWLLLSYGKWAGGLKLFAAGSQGVSELKEHITDDNVYFAFCRQSVNGSHIYVTVAYIPSGVSGLRRTRAISTSRTVQSWFKASQAMLMLSSLDDLSAEALIQAARSNELPEKNFASELISRSSSDCYDTQKSLPRPPIIDPQMRRAHSVGPETRTASPAPAGFRPLPDFGDPAERAKRRNEARLQQMAADEIAARDEALRQARIKREKEEAFKLYEDEETQRRLSLERDLKRSAMAKAEKEEEERRAAEQRALDRERKKRADFEKRLAEAKRIEAWRQDEQRRLDDLARREEDAARQAESDKLASRLSALQLRKERLANDDQVLLRGWVTIQNPTSFVWRRRWFELSPTGMSLYRSDKDVGKALDTIALAGRVEAVKEWNDGFEELRSIPHSFAIILRGNGEPVLAYSDTSKDKVDLVGFLLTYE